MSWQSTIIRKPWIHGPSSTNWTVLLPAEDLKLPLPCIQMASSSILRILVYFPVIQNVIKRLTLFFPKCLWQEVTTQGGIHKEASHQCRRRYLEVSFCRRANCVGINSNLSPPENNLSRRESMLTMFLLKQKEIFSLQYILALLNHSAKSTQIKRKAFFKLWAHSNTANLCIKVLICS